jgi:hypothetical protein
MLIINNTKFVMPVDREEAILVKDNDNNIKLSNLFITDVKYAKILLPILSVLFFFENIWKHYFKK